MHPVDRIQVCPVETTLAVIGGRWKPLLLYHLREGPRRFNALRRLIPDATQRMLTQHLRDLERDGVVVRTVYAQVPPRVDYALTTLGESLVPLMDQMAAWGAAYQRPTDRDDVDAEAAPSESVRQRA